MAGIFPSPTGVPAANTDNGYEPALAPIGGPARFYGRECQTQLYHWALNALTSEILAAVDRLGYAYNSGRVDNLGAALADVIGNMQLSLTAALSDIGDLQSDMASADAAIAALQGDVSGMQVTLAGLGNDVDAIQAYLSTLEAAQVALSPAIGGYTNVRSLLTALSANLGPVPDQRFMGNNSGGPATPFALTAAQAAAMLPLAGGNKGLMRALSGVTSEYMAGDGNWRAFGAVIHGAVYLTQVGTDIRLIREGSGGLIIQGQAVTLPAAGLSLSPTGAVAGTEYYVYAWMNAGVMELGKTPKATGRSLDANGVWIITGNPGWTLVGMAYCATNGAWRAKNQDLIDDRLSFFNRKSCSSIAVCSAVVASSLTFSILSPGGTSGQCLTWGDEAVTLGSAGTAATSAAGGISRGCAGLDVTTNLGNYLQMQSYGASAACAVASYFSGIVAEGRHVVVCLGASSSGSNGTYSMSAYLSYRG